MSSAVEKRLGDMGNVLPPVGQPKGSYVLYQKVGSMIYTAGHIPQKEDGTLWTGKVGAELTVEEGQEAARAATLALIATLKEASGDLDKCNIVKITGFVNCPSTFAAQPTVINGASDLLAAAFEGQMGLHARSALGANALPLDVAVEIEAIVEII
ncbi:unnamed protein product [Chrysoparadoxa australica]